MEYFTEIFLRFTSLNEIFVEWIQTRNYKKQEIKIVLLGHYENNC